MVDKGRAVPSLIPEDLQVVSCDVDINHFAFLNGKSGRFEFLAEPTNSWICSPSPLPLCQRLKPSPYAQQSFWWGARDASASDGGEAYVGIFRKTKYMVVSLPFKQNCSFGNAGHLILNHPSLREERIPQRTSSATSS